MQISIFNLDFSFGQLMLLSFFVALGLTVFIGFVYYYTERSKKVYSHMIAIDKHTYAVTVFIHRSKLFRRTTQILISGRSVTMPNMLLDSTDKSASLYFGKHDSFANYHRRSLSGGMDSHFTVFIPDDVKIESLQFLTPDVLWFLKENFSQFDILFENGVVDMRKAGIVEIEHVKEAVPYLIEKIHRIHKYWDAQDYRDFLV